MPKRTVLDPQGQTIHHALSGLGYAAITALAIAALTAALFGTQVWTDFFTQGLAAQNRVLNDPAGIATPFHPTIFMNLRGIGASFALAMTVQLVVATIAAAAVFWVFRFRRDASGGDGARLLATHFRQALAASADAAGRGASRR